MYTTNYSYIFSQLCLRSARQNIFIVQSFKYDYWFGKSVGRWLVDLIKTFSKIAKNTKSLSRCQLYSYFDKHIFGRYQYGFCKKFSAKHASLLMIAKINFVYDNKNCSREQKNIANFIKRKRTHTRIFTKSGSCTKIYCMS